MADDEEISELRDQGNAGRPEIGGCELDGDEAQHEPQQRMYPGPAKCPIPWNAPNLAPENLEDSETGTALRARLVLALAQMLGYAVHDAAAGLAVLVELRVAWAT